MATELDRFLDTVITTPEGWLCLLMGLPPDLKEEWYKWPVDRDKVAERVKEKSSLGSVYFSPHLFSKADSHKDFVLPTKTIVADLDAASLSNIPLAPTILVQTSPGRHQGYWVLQDELSKEDHERLSRRVTYSIPDCDHSGWPLGHRFRVPTTLNYKYKTLPTIFVAASSYRTYDPLTLREHTQEEVASPSQALDQDFISSASSISLEDGPNAILEKYRRGMGRAAQGLNALGSGPEGRSGALWALMMGMFRGGASREEVYWVSKHSVNNKFAESKYHGEEDLAKDVLRAERQTKVNNSDLRTVIFTILRGQGLMQEKRQLIAQLVQETLEKDGDFVVCDDNTQWYLRKDTGRPIPLTRRGELIDAMLDMRFGLNATDGLTAHVVSRLMAFTLDRGRPATQASLSSYAGRNQLLLHGGRNDIWDISTTSITKVANGEGGVLFPWRIGELPFVLPTQPEAFDWPALMFEDFFDNLVDITKEEAIALTRIWFIFLLFRDAASARPLLALFGQPGSGKSTFFRLLYVLLYGPRKALNAVSNPDNFDSLVSTDPFVVFDNVDTWAAWLPDRLALSAAASDLVKRKLYTDNDTVVIRRQALVGISAHNPRFGREDVVDRMLIFNFERLKSFKPESEMAMRVLRNRPKIWGAIALDVQAVLAQRDPRDEELPQFRITDFARLGLRIARALDLEAPFRSGLSKMKSAQLAFNLSEEDALVDVLRSWTTAERPGYDEFLPVARLWENLCTMDPMFERSYRSSIIFGKKLWTMAESLKTQFNLEYKYNTSSGSRTWRIGAKQDA